MRYEISTEMQQSMQQMQQMQQYSTRIDNQLRPCGSFQFAAI